MIDAFGGLKEEREAAEDEASLGIGLLQGPRERLFRSHDLHPSPGAVRDRGGVQIV